MIIGNVWLVKVLNKNITNQLQNVLKTGRETFLLKEASFCSHFCSNSFWLCTHFFNQLRLFSFGILQLYVSYPLTDGFQIKLYGKQNKRKETQQGMVSIKTSQMSTILTEQKIQQVTEKWTLIQILLSI